MMVFFKSAKLPGARGRSNYYSSILLRDLCKAVATARERRAHPCPLGRSSNATSVDAVIEARLMREPFRITPGNSMRHDRDMKWFSHTV